MRGESVGEEKRLKKFQKRGPEKKEKFGKVS